MNFALRCARLVGIGLISCLLAACGGGGGSGPSTPSTPAPLALDLKTPFNDAGLTLAVGQTVTITATGTFNNGVCAGASCNSTPAGKPWSDCANLPPPAFTAPGLPCYSLIGRIGASGTPFEVGTSLVLTATTAGELFLGVNDNYYPDNTGSWSISIVHS